MDTYNSWLLSVLIATVNCSLSVVLVSLMLSILVKAKSWRSKIATPPPSLPMFSVPGHSYVVRHVIFVPFISKCLIQRHYSR